MERGNGLLVLLLNMLLSGDIFRGQVTSCTRSGITECNIHRGRGTPTALRDVNGKEFYPILVFNSPRESTQLHKSSNPPWPHVCDTIPPPATPSASLPPRYGRPDATLPKIDTKTSSEPRFNLKKKNIYIKNTISPGTSRVVEVLDGFIFTFLFSLFSFCNKLAIGWSKKKKKKKEKILYTYPINRYVKTCTTSMSY